MRKKMMIRCWVMSLTIAGVAGSASLADWPQFRGENSAGVVAGPTIPTEFNPGKNELWSVPVGLGHSSPCIVGDLLFLTTYDEQQRRLEVVCFSRVDGSVRWRRSVPTDKIESGHPSFNPASSTPTSDGDLVVAYFGSFGLICFDRDGGKLWERKMPLTKSYAGNATSPAIIGDRVILYRGNHVDHFLLALDKKSGKQIWKIDQAEPFASELACTSCPIVVGEKLIVHGARSVQAFRIDTGERLWVAKCATTATSTPVVAGGEVIVAAWNKMGEPALRPTFPSFGQLLAQHDRDQNQQIGRDELPRIMIFHRPDGAEAPQNGAAIRFQYVDRDNDGEISKQEWGSSLLELEKFRAGYDQHGILAIPLDSEGVVDPARIRTLAKQGIPEVPSPLCKDGLVYFVKNGGVLTCLDQQTGERLGRIRTEGRGTHYASPVIADGKVFSTAGNGRISVLTLGPKPKVLAVNDMGDDTYATPAIVDGVVYVRTHSRLYAFGKAE